MDAAAKTVTLLPGPAAFVYVCDAAHLDLEKLALLAARSRDSPLAVLPLLRGLTVEATFAPNVAVVAGTKTTGLGGAGLTAKLTPSHYHPNVFVFHGGERLRPSTAAPNLTRACEQARRRFGFGAFAGAPVDGAVETTAADICRAVGASPEAAVLFLVTTEAFKETVYMCNTFLHYGGASQVQVGAGEATRVPLYPVQLYMPDVNRVNLEPFNARQRAIGEQLAYPRPFYNAALCELLHGYVLGPAAVALRVRSLDAVARGAAHLAFDESHEGAVLPPDVCFTVFDSAAGRGGGGGGGRGGGGRGAEPGASKAGAAGAGLERRLASVMAADTAVSIEAAMSTSVLDEDVASADEWPMLQGAADEAAKLDALGAYMARLAGLVGAMVFSSNSVLYMTEVDDGGAADAKDGAAAGFHRFYQIAAPYVAGNPRCDKDGKPLPQAGAGGPAASINGAGQEFALDHLALACGFCPQLLARVLFYLERCDAGAFVGRNDTDALKYVASTLEGDVPCGLCARDDRHVCAHTTLYRLRHRLPRFGAPTRSPLGVFGTMNSAYSDCDVLGNYASYSALRRPGADENAKSIMQATYRAAVENVLAQLEQQRLLAHDAASAAQLERAVADHAGFRAALAAIQSTVEQVTEAFVRGLVEERSDFKMREALYDANHTLSLALDPYSTAVCPATAFLFRRSVLAVVQDLALSQCHGIFCGQPVDGRNFRAQFQPVLRRRFMDLLNGGFLTTRTVTVTLAESAVPAPNLAAAQTEPPARDMDGDLSKVSLEVFREMRVKNRVMFSAGGANMSEAARARVLGLASAYQRPEGAGANILSGPLGFLVKQFHRKLFPGGKPPGSQTPNPQWFWTLLQRNQMPARLLSKEDIETIGAVKRFSDAYAAINYVNLTPSNVAELAQFYMANLVLRYCDHKQFFINGLTAVVAGARRPRDPASVMHWVCRRIADAADAAAAAEEVLRGAEARPEVWAGTFAASHLVRSVMATRPAVVLGLSISKYNGSAGNNRVFQAGNWSGLNGGKNVCPLLCFDRTRRFVLACPRAGFVCAAAGAGGANRDNTLVEALREIIHGGGGALAQTAVYAAVLQALGARVEHLDLDDWTALVEDEFFAQSMVDLTERAAARPGGWSPEGASELLRELELEAAAEGDEPAGGAFDFGACVGAAAPEAPAFAAAGAAAAAPGSKRPDLDELFEVGVPEKRPALTLDMV
ncbi:single-stranded DNA-binding protein [Cervid alphaherpesvirus 2]|uniref:Single-stranded DNA-binding protein n=1 Tax=Cervid alphaherpesvirus 2 TaxID=365327 RepID=A0A455JNW2_9ALPH|nr:single-stranded DNA-binding protein [Cervid alphaherpesvirus 2]AVT50750.1 single-stranded DNA-binding protein [Cervid alphaherpesvirus 2]